MATAISPGSANSGNSNKRTRVVNALEIAGLSKSFGGARALDGVSFSLRPGEVHGLLGQNGSGKSTLIKVLSGYHAPDPGGSLSLFGQPVPLPLLPGQSKQLGIAFVHQNLGLVPSLSVLENLRVGAFAEGRGLLINWRAERRTARELFARFGLALDPDATVANLPPLERALLAIVRAFADLRHADSGGILVLDEPTPFLPRRDVERLFALVRGVVREGASVILVSHDIDEVMEITNRATVLRDGHVAGTVETARTAREDLLELIVGRRIEAHRRAAGGGVPTHRGEAGGIRLSGLTGGGVTGIDLACRAGEIVGLTGLIGSGYAALPYLLYDPPRGVAGELLIGDPAAGGHRVAISRLGPGAAQALGIALLPGDRLGAAGVGDLSITDNITLPMLQEFLAPYGLRRRQMAQTAGRLGAALELRPNRPALPLEALSGGNQQKVLLAKWLHTKPRLLLLDEPTQGVDFGARQQIFAALDAAARAGTAILCASTDYEQLAQICDRVLVFRGGRIAEELAGDALSKTAIAHACMAAPDEPLAA